MYELLRKLTGAATALSPAIIGPSAVPPTKNQAAFTNLYTAPRMGRVGFYEFTKIASAAPYLCTSTLGSGR